MRIFLMVLLLPVIFGMLIGCGISQNGKNPAEDALIVAQVRGKLAALDVDTVGNVFVRARDGVVTLRGKARSEPQIAHFREVAVDVSGVRSVVTQLHVDPHLSGASEQWRDVALEAQVKANLAAQAGVNAFSVKTRVSDGVVTLEGTAVSSALRSVMEAAATKTHGVKKVIDKLKVTSVG